MYIHLHLLDIHGQLNRGIFIWGNQGCSIFNEWIKNGCKTHWVIQREPIEK